MKKHNVDMGSIDFTLFSTVMLLVAIGIVMIYSASSYSAFFQYKDSMYFLKRQGLWVIIGIGCMFFMIKVDYHKIKKYTGMLMIFTFVLLVVVLLFPPLNGARRWIRLPAGANIQPSEIAKYVVTIYMAKSMENKGEKIKTFTYGIIPYLLVSGFFAGMVYIEKNLSIAAVIMIVTMLVLFVAGAKTKHLSLIFLLLAIAGAAGIYFEPYRMARFMNFTNPWADPKGDGYQLIQSLLALGSGGIWGVGLGQSRQKCYYIPEPHNDFIFSIVGEELGFIGCALIVILFVIFIWRGIVTAVNSKDTFGTLLATGITCVVAVQAIINIAVVTGSMPVTGVPLPFISYGGSSLLFNLIAIGVLLNISRQK